MSRYLYSATLAPIGKPFRSRVPGEGDRLFRLDEFCLPLASRAKVRAAHGDADIGEFAAVVRRGGWYVGDFMLDADIVTEDVERDIRVGQPLSVGFDIVRSQVDADGVENILEGRLAEVSLVQRGRIPGAKITGKHEFQPVPKREPSKSAPRPTVIRPVATRRAPARPAGRDRVLTMSERENFYALSEFSDISRLIDVLQDTLRLG